LPSHESVSGDQCYAAVLFASGGGNTKFLCFSWSSSSPCLDLQGENCKTVLHWMCLTTVHSQIRLFWRFFLNIFWVLPMVVIDSTMRGIVRYGKAFFSFWLYFVLLVVCVLNVLTRFWYSFVVKTVIDIYLMSIYFLLIRWRQCN
jgi:hypothetical protein